MILKTTGTVLGVRESDYTLKSTGEVRTRRMLDLYDPEDGPAELQLADDVEKPEPGTQVEAKVAVRAWSGFVRDGVAGDARVQFTCVALAPIEVEGATPMRRRKPA
jgi:hypothetical protein